MGWVLAYADLLSALFGLAAAIVLGWPSLNAVREKRRWERQRRLETRHRDDPDNREALEDIHGHVEAGQLGGADEARLFNLVGFGLLAISFLFLGLAALDRRREHAPPPSNVPAAPSAAPMSVAPISGAPISGAPTSGAPASQAPPATDPDVGS